MKKNSRTSLAMVGRYYLDMFDKSLTVKEREGAATHLRMMGKLYHRQCEQTVFPALEGEPDPYEDWLDNWGKHQ